MWLPHLRKWCSAYSPDDLILCNANNGTERLNKDLKYDDLSGYKNCSFSVLLSVVIELPKHYRKYVELNIRYGDGCKKCAPGIPEFLRNRPRQNVELLLDKMYRVTDNISVTTLDNATFPVTSVVEETRLRRDTTSKIPDNLQRSFDEVFELNEDRLAELPLQRSLIKSKKLNIRANLKQLSDLTYTTNDLELVEELDSKVKEILNRFTLKICQGDLNELPETSDSVKKTKRRIPQQDLAPPKKKKHPFAERVGEVADMMAQFYRAKVKLPHEKEDSTVILESVLEEDKICSAVDTNGDNVKITFPGEIIVEGALM